MNRKKPSGMKYAFTQNTEASSQKKQACHPEWFQTWSCYKVISGTQKPRKHLLQECKFLVPCSRPSLARSYSKQEEREKFERESVSIAKSCYTVKWKRKVIHPAQARHAVKV